MKDFHFRSLKQIFLILVMMMLVSGLWSQTQPELETARVMMGRVWVGVKANGDKGNFEYRYPFFPNDYDILGVRGQQTDLWGAAGFTLAATDWKDPNIADSVHAVAVYGPTNDFMPQGKVVEPLSNYVRFGYPKMLVDLDSLTIDNFGQVTSTMPSDQSYDQIVKVTSKNILGVHLDRKVMAWSNSLNDDYVIIDVEFTNVSNDSLKNFYINVASNGENTYHSTGMNPRLRGEEEIHTAYTWQHYYGGRVGDSLRVFYEYSADDPTIAGDDMGKPALSQSGRLVFPKFVWYSILHASKSPHTQAARDEDDFLQPKVTYLGKSNLIPYNDASDEFGNKNFWALRGEYSKYLPMSGETWPGTFHGINSDETGSKDFSHLAAISKDNNNSKMSASFGPYTFASNEKIRLVFAHGYSGLSLEKAQEIGKGWFKGTLEEAPALPNDETGYLPAEFVFPDGATEMDRRKDRWVSTGIDSLMKSASRAKWNFDHDYKIPLSPPPPTDIEITGLGTGVELKWQDRAAEEMDNFGGYRIMRRISNTDTVFYNIVYNSDENDVAEEHLFVDKTVVVGAQYYYYIQAKVKIDENDLTAHPDTRGKIMYSNRVLHPNLTPVFPPYFSQDDLSEIRIVPNPYNINDPLLDQTGWTDRRGLMFLNLPSEVKIKIFTENGDWVQTLKHFSPPTIKAGNLRWDMITRNQQVISSGVYIAVFETPDGRTSFQKFLVVR
ncbi:MAG: hypothetical protein JXQ65_02735 [Candidatus Marinimicrobia bacterium]|nr:hypothetical protein [Candidatus Neomarinimicrobiota bacterium]